MRDADNHATRDYRWYRASSDERLSCKETLIAMAAYYGTFSGRWHSSQFWAKVARDAPDMDEAACEAKVRRIERDADAELATWVMYQ